MSGRDIEFIKHLSISSSDVARILDVSRQSVSRGLRSDGDYLNESKLAIISKEVPRVYDIDPKLIQRLIDKFYPHYSSGVRRFEVARKINISIDSDIYFACNRLPYYMSVYKKLFADLAGYIHLRKNQKLIFAFPDPEALRYSQRKLLHWLGDKNTIANSSVIICPAVAAFPFSICGLESKKHAVYFCENDGFARQNEINSRCIVSYVIHYIDTYKNRLKPLRNDFDANIIFSSKE